MKHHVDPIANRTTNLRQSAQSADRPELIVIRRLRRCSQMGKSGRVAQP